MLESSRGRRRRSVLSPRVHMRTYPSCWKFFLMLVAPFIIAFVTVWLLVFVIIPVFFGGGSNSANLQVLMSSMVIPIWFASGRGILRVIALQLMNGSQAIAWVGLYLLAAQSILLTRIINAVHVSFADQVRATCVVALVQFVGRTTLKFQHMAASTGGTCARPTSPAEYRMSPRQLWLAAHSIVLVSMCNASTIPLMNIAAFVVKAQWLGMSVPDAIIGAVQLSAFQIVLDTVLGAVNLAFEDWCGIPVMAVLRTRWRFLAVAVFLNGIAITLFLREYLAKALLTVLGEPIPAALA